MDKNDLKLAIQAGLELKNQKLLDEEKIKEAMLLEKIRKQKQLEELALAKADEIMKNDFKKEITHSISLNRMQVGIYYLGSNRSLFDNESQFNFHVKKFLEEKLKKIGLSCFVAHDSGEDYNGEYPRTWNSYTLAVTMSDVLNILKEE